MAHDGLTYRQSGVEVALGDACSKLATEASRRTLQNRHGRAGAVVPGSLGGYSPTLAFGPQRIGVTSDGIGTKIELAERTASYHSLAFDLLAMVADDLIAAGIEPSNVANILDVDRLDASVVSQLMQGLEAAAAEAGVAIVGGEIAELGSRVGGYGPGMHFNWTATALGVPLPGFGGQVSAGDTLVAVASDGLRSNGFSLARAILSRVHGEHWHETLWQGKSWGAWLLTPSRIYCRHLVAAHEAGIQLKAVAHITGGGLPSKLRRILPSGCGAVLDELFPPQDWVLALQRLGGVADAEAYRCWNMGNGLCVVAEDPAGLVAFLAERGLQARPAGRVEVGNSLRLKNLGAEAGEAWLELPLDT